MPEPVLFEEADLESERLGESDARCSYPPAESEISELRKPDGELPSSDSRVTLRAPAPSSALLELSGIEYVSAERDEPLRESREPFRLAIRDTWPESQLATPPLASRLRTVKPPPDVEDALRRAARSSFASIPPEASDRQSGVRISAPHSIEEAVLRVVEAEEPLPDKIPKA